MRYNTSDFDIIYLSYDEPKADEFYADLKGKFPRAKRVHGVKGFDAAHKACANLSETDRFITVDGDNIVDEAFFDLSFEVPDDHEDCVFSWGARNMTNGLLYGNGGLKCWPKDFVLGMRTHESADSEESKVDFCWDLKYVQFEGTFCQTIQTGSPFQAFRAGFREGVKLTLDRGRKVSLFEFDHDALWHGNLKRLEIWASVGADVENGLWSVYGARLGAYMTNLTDWDHSQISDYDWFESFWENSVGGSEDPEDYDVLWTASVLLGRKLRRSMGLNLGDLDGDASRFFKHVYVAPSRTGYN